MFMEKIGIICEYNPFHNGHLYHLNEIKKIYPDSIIILVMSGYFTERGDISLISKYNKTRIALDYGVDIVLELPTLYSINSADYFGNFAVSILNEIGVEKIIFGSERNNADELKKAALKQNDEKFQNNIKKIMSTGINYPTALATILNEDYDSNDILGISYIKSIINNKYNIEIETIKRTNKFNDTLLDDNIVSAENIRIKLNDGIDITKYIPNYNSSYINKIDYNKLFDLLKYKIITELDLKHYLGVDEGIEAKIKKEINHSTNLNDLIYRIKSKRYTYVRIKRMLMHILLGIKKNDMEEKNEYVRILGFNRIGQAYLKKNNNKRIVYKYNNRIRNIELVSSEIYYMITNDKSVNEEYLNKPIIKDKLSNEDSTSCANGITRTS